MVPAAVADRFNRATVSTGRRLAPFGLAAEGCGALGGRLAVRSLRLPHAAGQRCRSPTCRCCCRCRPAPQHKHEGSGGGVASNFDTDTHKSGMEPLTERARNLTAVAEVRRRQQGRLRVSLATLFPPPQLVPPALLLCLPCRRRCGPRAPARRAPPRLASPPGGSRLGGGLQGCECLAPAWHCLAALHAWAALRLCFNSAPGCTQPGHPSPWPPPPCSESAAQEGEPMGQPKGQL